MSRQDYDAPRADVHPHDHAVFVYDDEQGIIQPLDAFIQEGMKHGDLSVFVHSFKSTDHARSFLNKGIPHLHAYEQKGDLSAAFYKDSFEKGGRIDYGHVEGVVGMLKATAQSTGRRAPRVFVDASKNYFDAGRADEWFAFEAWLGPRLQAEMGLVCAYRAKDLKDPNVLRRVLETHEYRFDAKA